MSKPNPKKISTTSGSASLENALGNAFAGLALGALPPGAEAAPEPPAKAPKLGRVILRKETAHRGGKSVIVIDGFAPTVDETFISALAKRLRNACGCGGTVRERTIELQGDQPAKVRQSLLAEGFQVGGITK